MTQDRLHIVNGDGAAGAIEAAGLAAHDDILVLHDVLSCGPLNPFDGAVGPGPWLAGRENLWRDVWAAARALGYLEGDFPGFADKPRNLFDGRARLQEASRVVVHGAVGLSDLLTQAVAVAWLETIGVPSERVRLVREFEGPDGRPLAGLPYLTPGELAERYAPRTIPSGDRVLLRAFLDGYCAPHPGALLTMREAPPAPWLAPALDAWFGRFPDQRGLDRWDERLLLAFNAAGDEPGPPTTLGELLGAVLRSHQGDCDPIGDLALLHRLLALADVPELVTLGEPAGSATPVGLTPRGRRVLEGETTSVPIPREVGGVALVRDGALAWIRRENDRLEPGGATMGRETGD